MHHSAAGVWEGGNWQTWKQSTTLWQDVVSELPDIQCRSTTGRPFGPFIVSLVIAELLDDLGHMPDDSLQMQFLDDDTFVGPCTSISTLLSKIPSYGPDHSLILNCSKHKVFWPFGDQSFPEFPSEVCRPNLKTGSIKFLGCPLCGSHDLFDSSLSKCIDKVLECQDLLSDLENPQVELQLLQSCVSLCKVNHSLCHSTWTLVCAIVWNLQ